MIHATALARRGGYTILELMIAVAITLVLMMLVNQLFFDTVRAVGRGTALSDIISSGREAGRQIQEDAEAMYGVGEPSISRELGQGGFLVIINRIIGDWDNSGALNGDDDMNGILDPEEIESLPVGERENPEGVAFSNPDGTEFRRFVRSDQLVFIRHTNPELIRTYNSPRINPPMPLCPVNEDAFTTPEIDVEQVPYIRVWYGHVRKTDLDGTDPRMGPTDDDDPETSDGALGRPGPNRLGHQWVLGRQALFLMHGPEEGFNTFVKGAWYNVGDGDMEGYDTEEITPSNLRYLHMGIADIARYRLDSGSDLIGAMVGGISTDVEPDPRRLWSIDESSMGGTPTARYNEYKRRALTNYTYAMKRLRANPTPEGAALQSWQVAQTHPVFLSNVSDFIIEFAADRTKENDFTWLPEGNVDYYIQPSLTSGRLIKWYVHTPYANWPDYYYSGTTYDDDDYDSNRPDTFPIQFPKDDDPTVLETDPSYLDDTAGVYPHADGAFVWRHDDKDASSSNLWPYLIRIRYRLHDPKGQYQEFNVATGRVESGKWFEHVIPVDRPR